jgi:hypothetical protein
MISVAFTSLAFLVYFGRSWEIGAALLALRAVLVGIVQFAGYGATFAIAPEGVEVPFFADTAKGTIGPRASSCNLTAPGGA